METAFLLNSLMRMAYLSMFGDTLGLVVVLLLCLLILLLVALFLSSFLAHHGSILLYSMSSNVGNGCKWALLC